MFTATFRWKPEQLGFVMAADEELDDVLAEEEAWVNDEDDPLPYEESTKGQIEAGVWREDLADSFVAGKRLLELVIRNGNRNIQTTHIDLAGLWNDEEQLDELLIGEGWKRIDDETSWFESRNVRIEVEPYSDDALALASAS